MGAPGVAPGLWESWRDKASGEKIETHTIVTAQPNEVAAKIHNRMPVIIDPRDYDRWLAAPQPPGSAAPYPAPEMLAYPVSRAVNKAGQESPERWSKRSRRRSDGRFVTLSDRRNCHRISGIALPPHADLSAV